MFQSIKPELVCLLKYSYGISEFLKQIGPRQSYNFFLKSPDGFGHTKHAQFQLGVQFPLLHPDPYIFLLLRVLLHLLKLASQGNQKDKKSQPI